MLYTHEQKIATFSFKEWEDKFRIVKGVGKHETKFKSYNNAIKNAQSRGMALD